MITIDIKRISSALWSNIGSGYATNGMQNDSVVDVVCERDCIEIGNAMIMGQSRKLEQVELRTTQVTKWRLN